MYFNVGMTVTGRVIQDYRKPTRIVTGVIFRMHHDWAMVDGKHVPVRDSWANVKLDTYEEVCVILDDAVEVK